ncbi:MAG TPA: SRPBCC family protein [Burkholderiales bacterium]|jgi:ribosome-associated toxin RatA of RatAB toxin-antitoxin module|nr:SRPBCC family protein [Burkholderiales bacterium]
MHRLLWVALAFPSLCHAADMSLQAARHGDSFKVEAAAEFEAEVTLAWEVLTDYNRLSEFIPGMHSSRIVSRNKRSVIVDQSGEARLLFLSFPIKVRLEVQEFPYERIVSRAIEGNFKELRGAYTLEVRGRHLLLHYTGSLTPDFSIPPLIGTILVRNTMEKRFGAMVDEIMRRQRLRELPAVRPFGSRG